MSIVPTARDQEQKAAISEDAHLRRGALALVIYSTDVLDDCSFFVSLERVAPAYKYGRETFRGKFLIVNVCSNGKLNVKNGSFIYSYEVRVR
jgi:hypothetical protein